MITWSADGVQTRTPAISSAAAVATPTAAAAAPSKARRRRVRGGSGTIIHQGFLEDIEPNRELRGAKWYGSIGKAGIADKMLRDPKVRATVYYITDALCCAKWRFKSPSSDAASVECAQYMTWNLVERLPHRQLLRRLVRNYMAYGASLLEVTDDTVDVPTPRFPLHKGHGKGIALTGFHDRPLRTIERWTRSKKNTSQLAGVIQRLHPTDGEQGREAFIPADRILRHTWDQDGADFTGLAPLRSAYGAWKIKQALLVIDAMKHERTGLGTPRITLGEDADEADIAACEILLAEMRANAKGFLVLPNGFEFAWEGASESDSSNIEQAIQRCNIEIALNVVSGHMLLGLQKTGGSFALSNTQSGAHNLHVDGHASFILDGFNHGSDGWSLVERIARLNYGAQVSIPVLEARNLPTRNWRAQVETTVKAIAAGAITADERLEEEFREALEWGPHDPTTARERPVSLGTPPKKDKARDDDEEDDDEAMEAAA